jgi:hypothetical protein
VEGPSLPPWVPVFITVALGMIGLGIQACLLAYFLGKMKEHQAGSQALVDAFKEFTNLAIANLTQRLDGVDEFANVSRLDRGAMTARLQSVERNTEGLQGLREGMAGLTATFQAHRERTESDLAHVNRSLEGLQRQLANLVSGGSGRVVVMGKEADGG